MYALVLYIYLRVCSTDVFGLFHYVCLTVSTVNYLINKLHLKLLHDHGGTNSVFPVVGMDCNFVIVPVIIALYYGLSIVVVVLCPKIVKTFADVVKHGTCIYNKETC